jgi:hypothetical protein
MPAGQERREVGWNVLYRLDTRPSMQGLPDVALQRLSQRLVLLTSFVNTNFDGVSIQLMR